MHKALALVSDGERFLFDKGETYDGDTRVSVPRVDDIGSALLALRSRRILTARDVGAVTTQEVGLIPEQAHFFVIAVGSFEPGVNGAALTSLELMRAIRDGEVFDTDSLAAIAVLCAHSAAQL